MADEAKGCPCRMTCCAEARDFVVPEHAKDHHPEFCALCHAVRCGACGATCPGNFVDGEHRAPEPPSLAPMIEHHQEKLRTLLEKHEEQVRMKAALSTKGKV